jgi:hypothetical protein
MVSLSGNNLISDLKEIWFPIKGLKGYLGNNLIF